jgi:hypothetical protein
LNKRGNRACNNIPSIVSLAGAFLPSRRCREVKEAGEKVAQSRQSPIGLSLLRLPGFLLSFQSRFRGGCLCHVLVRPDGVGVTVPPATRCGITPSVRDNTVAAASGSCYLLLLFLISLLIISLCEAAKVWIITVVSSYKKRNTHMK